MSEFRSLASIAAMTGFHSLEFHPLANIFPLLEGEEFDQLVESIRASDGPRGG